MLIAVLDRHTNIALGSHEVYASTVGGMSATEPAADLAIALAVASAMHFQALPQNLCAIGEVSLSGDIRRVGSLDRRLAEAARLGFTHALVPAGHAGDTIADSALQGLTPHPIGTLADAIAAIKGLSGGPRRARRPNLRSVRSEQKPQ
jgi:DNA repair protein RadA/Sms